MHFAASVGFSARFVGWVMPAAGTPIPYTDVKLNIGDRWVAVVGHTSWDRWVAVVVVHE